jgi:Zinc carboxypeptidase
MKTAIIAAVLVSSSLLCGCHSRPDASPPALSAQSTQLKTHAELTGYEETSRYAEVIAFFNQLRQRSPLIHTEIFGRSGEGRALPLFILSDPPIAEPRAAKLSGKPVIFIMANIHAGEVEGKEAMQILARRLLTGDLRYLLAHEIILVAPIYNADGNEKISLQNRTDQNGPIGGVGARENSQGLDLNRDYTKLESPEANALVRLFNRWDPHLTLDLHTTDGSYHAYHLTYSPMLNPDSAAVLSAYERDQLLPAISHAMLAQHKLRTFYYGDSSAANSEHVLHRPVAPNADTTMIWRTFDPRPRYGNNYVGLRNRLTILSEAYSHLDFQGRVRVTEAFVEEILKYAARHGRELKQLTRRADEETVQHGLSKTPWELGIQFEAKPSPHPEDILVGEVTPLKNPRSNTEMIAMVENKVTPTKMLTYGEFSATRTTPLPRAYLFRRESGLQVVVEKLLAHGIRVEELTAPLAAEVQGFAIGAVSTAQQPYQGHHEVNLAGEFKNEAVTFPAGTILVRTAQPLGTLAAYLLEPESDDGLTTWNFLDSYLERGKTYPIYKLMPNQSIPPTVTRHSSGGAASFGP